MNTIDAGAVAGGRPKRPRSVGLARTIWPWLLAVIALLVGACGGEDEGAPGAASEAASGAPIAFEGSVEPLRGFSFDTGLVPSGSPVAASFKLAAGGKVKVTATGEVESNRLIGTQKSGEVALEVRFTMAGRLKIDSPLKKIDEELPGLANIDIPIQGKAAFDPFLLDDGDNAVVAAAVPETKLPAIPLGSVPGKLELTVTKESKLRSSFHGECLSVTDGKATYRGRLGTSGTLVLSGRILVDLPPPLNTPVDLGVISVDIPESSTALDLGTREAPDADDQRNGSTCPASSGGESDRNGGGGNGGNAGDGDDGSGGEGQGDGGTGPSPDGGVTNRTYVGTLAKTAAPAVFGGGAGNCTYDMTLEAIAITLLVQGSQVINGSVSNQTVERVLGSCPYPPASRGQQTFTLFAPTATGTRLTFVGATSNKPRASVTVDLVPTGNGYDATIRWHRTDLGPPFDWSVTANVYLSPM